MNTLLLYIKEEIAGTETREDLGYLHRQFRSPQIQSGHLLANKRSCLLIFCRITKPQIQSRERRERQNGHIKRQKNLTTKVLDGDWSKPESISADNSPQLHVNSA